MPVENSYQISPITGRTTSTLRITKVYVPIYGKYVKASVHCPSPLALSCFSSLPVAPSSPSPYLQLPLSPVITVLYLISSCLLSLLCLTFRSFSPTSSLSLIDVHRQRPLLLSTIDVSLQVVCRCRSLSINGLAQTINRGCDAW